MRWEVGVRAELSSSNRLILRAMALLICVHCCGLRAQQTKSPDELGEKSPATLPSQILSITGEIPHPLQMDAQALAALPAKQVIVKDRAGHPVTYRGPLLRDVLAKAGLVIGNDPSHGHRAPLCVLVIASDGYRSVLSLSELDASLRDRPIILASQRDDRKLDSKEGPLRLIVADESKPERWIRQVSAIKIVAVK